ncbi:histidine kinase [Cohnella ginsengisoli]|uniref:Histidine kinase n=1 Tax=Cohnella ginsengisoli TaxID=425004 RepID=A0A9X4QM48_9BACL|nr:sensor histidine kinase [Cohnella ginsengisoli]MDG0791539.1 histidine kinase [Cohnella ginsengisoli]
MKSVRIKSIHNKIFFRYSLLVLFIITTILVLFATYMSHVLRQESSRNMRQVSANIADTLDLEIRNMYATALKIAASEPVKESFFQDTSDPAILYENRNKLANIFLTVSGPMPTYYKINLYRNDGFRFEYGNQFNSYMADKNELLQYEWARQTFAMDGKKYISAPHLDATETIPRDVVSVSMAFAEVYGMRNDNIIEVEQDSRVFNTIIQRAVLAPDGKEDPNKAVYVFNREGEPIYADGSDKLPGKEHYAPYLRQLLDRQDDSRIETQTLARSLNGKKSIVSYTSSDFSGWTVILEEPESSLMRPIRLLIQNTVLLGLAFLIVTLFVTFYLSRSLSLPIRKLNRSIRNLDLETLSPRQAAELNSSFDELEELYQTFMDMKERLRESLEETVSARSHELQSRLLALQAQMSPHFLYNSLSVLGIMCEEGRNADALRFLGGLTSMLRYVSSGSQAPVRLADELKHTRDYILLIQERYGDMLEFEIQVPDGMLELEIPKLSIQPLAENAVKYATNAQPPWRIRIVGRLLTGTWLITVSDNGLGFEPERLSELKRRFAAADAAPPNVELQVNGMGLLNIYTRMRLLYGEEAIMDVHNRDHAGASVTIGGPLKQKKEALG